MAEIDCSDYDRVKLLKALYKGTASVGNGFLAELRNNDEKQWEEYAEMTSVDYVFGRPIKANFSDPSKVNFWLYERDSNMTAQQAIDAYYSDE